MGNTDKLPNASETRADKQQRDLRRIQLRRRIIGALAIAAIAAFFLQLGNIKTPPSINPPALPTTAIAKPTITPDLQDARRRLQQTPEIIKPTVQELSDSQYTDAADADNNANVISDSESDANNAANNINDSTIDNAGSQEAADLAAVSELFFEKIDSAPDSKNTNSQTSNGGFVVQIGAFAQDKRAKEISNFLRKKSYHVILENIVRDNKKITRVRVGVYKTRADAELARQELVALGYEDARINDLR